MDKRLPAGVPSLDELKKMIKHENLTGGRLTSLKLPRDLSLGGTKPKKVYTPNLNVIRNKDKNKHVAAKSERGQKRNASNMPQNGSSRQKNKRMKFVQSEGVFSQGMGETKRPTHHSDRGATVREQSKVATLVMPKINKSSWNVNNKKEEAELLSDLVADEESDSESDTEYDPIVLPLDLNKNNFTNAFKIKSEDMNPKIKKEEPSFETEVKVTDNHNGCSVAPDIKPNVTIKLENSNSIPEFTSFTDSMKVYDEDNLTFSALQLPNSFSGKIFKDDPNDKDSDYTVRHMPEGQIGKILIRRSGKMEMIIKNTKYILNGGSSGNFVEEAMQFPGKQSIALEPSLVTLGSISEKFTLTPEWNNLFDRAKRTNKFFW